MAWDASSRSIVLGDGNDASWKAGTKKELQVALVPRLAAQGEVALQQISAIGAVVA
jgi:hypothetical protein